MKPALVWTLGVLLILIAFGLLLHACADQASRQAELDDEYKTQEETVPEEETVEVVEYLPDTSGARA